MAFLKNIQIVSDGPIGVDIKQFLQEHIHCNAIIKKTEQAGPIVELYAYALNAKGNSELNELELSDDCDIYCWHDPDINI